VIGRKLVPVERIAQFKAKCITCTEPAWLGVPVDWGQISQARAIVEATLPDMDVELSQGSHFFHNLTSLKLAYLNVHHAGAFKIDFEWLDGQPAHAESERVRHVRLDQPLKIVVDGRNMRGVISK